MAEELALSRGERAYTDPLAVLEPFDEAELHAVLAEFGVETGLGQDDAGIFEPADGRVFWQLEPVRDGAGRVIALAGDHYHEPDATPESVDAFFDALAVLAGRLGATAWIYPGPRRLGAPAGEQL